MKKISFVCLEFPDGQGLLRCNKGVYEFWFISDGCGDMIYQFGCHCKSMEDFIELVEGNYENNNVVKQKYFSRFF